MKKISYIIALAVILFRHQSVLAGDAYALQDPLGGNVPDVQTIIRIFVDWIINLGIVAVVLAFTYTVLV